MSEKDKKEYTVSEILRNTAKILLLAIAVIVLIHTLYQFKFGKWKHGFNGRPRTVAVVEEIPSENIIIRKGVWSKPIVLKNSNDKIEWLVIQDDVWLKTEFNGSRVYTQPPWKYKEHWKSINLDNTITQIRFMISPDSKHVSGRDVATVTVSYINR